jgi:hypothetical protein
MKMTAQERAERKAKKHQRIGEISKEIQGQMMAELDAYHRELQSKDPISFFQWFSAEVFERAEAQYKRETAPEKLGGIGNGKLVYSLRKIIGKLLAKKSSKTGNPLYSLEQLKELLPIAMENPISPRKKRVKNVNVPTILVSLPVPAVETVPETVVEPVVETVPEIVPETVVEPVVETAAEKPVKKPSKPRAKKAKKPEANS